jgi:hypothetical protein
LISEQLAFFILHDVFASRHLHIQVSRNDSTVPTRCRHRSGIVDPAGYTACRALRQTTSPSNQILDPKSSKTSQFSVIRRFVGIDSHASKSYYHSYTVATSGANHLARQIYHNRLPQAITTEHPAHDIDRGLILSSCSAARTNVVFTNSYVDNNSSLISE